MHPLLATATLPDTITFAIAAVICVVGALGVVLSTHPVHSALMLVMTLFGVAVLFVEENAQFLAVVQVIVYAGAIVVLFLFVIMLLGVDRAEAIAADPLKGQRAVALLLGVLVLAEVVLLARGHWPTGAHSTAGALNQGTAPNVNVLGASVFTTFLLPFELTSALLVIAVIGAVVLARRPRRLGEGDPELLIVDPEDDDPTLGPDDSDESAGAGVRGMSDKNAQEEETAAGETAGETSSQKEGSRS
jgi:NADH-quinone oxidoreductase subunit J